MQLFSADHICIFKEIFLKRFDPEKVKKRTSKVAHNLLRPVYFTVQPRIDFSYH